MVILVVLAIGMLQLSAVALRTSSSSLVMAEARQNARLSMQMAIAQLQHLSGLDTRVTAPRLPANPSDPVDSIVPLTGVWRSWEGSDRDRNGKPITPNYDAKKLGGNAQIPLVGQAEGRFLGWLTSSQSSATPNPNVIPDVKNTADEGYIKLVADGSTSETTRRVFMKPTLLEGNKGAIAWWTSGDNSKAMINSDLVAKPSSVVQWHQRLRSNGRADAQTFGLASINDESIYPPGRIIPSTGNLRLINPKVDLRKIHDITAFNRGLLTNVATGGWKKDLSLMTEQYSILPDTNLPSYTLKPGEEQTFSKAKPQSHPPHSLLYPWARYRGAPSGPPYSQVPPICSWTALVDYAMQYQKLTSTGAARAVMPLKVNKVDEGSSAGQGIRFDFQDQVRRSPQLARLQWIYSLCSTKVTTDPADDRYKPGLLLTPVLTLWNPYNVELTMPRFDVLVCGVAPLNFSFKVGNNTFDLTNLLEITGLIDNNTPQFQLSGSRAIVLRMNQPVTLAPGATMIFSAMNKTPVVGNYVSNASSILEIAPGYTPGSGFMFFRINRRNEVIARAGDAFSIERVGYDSTADSALVNGSVYPFGVYIDLRVDPPNGYLAMRSSYTAMQLGGEKVLKQLYPALTNRLSVDRVDQVQDERNQAFASSIFGFRMVTPISPAPEHRHLFTKGMLQSNPLNSYAEVGGNYYDTDMSSMAGSGVFHPVNAPFDFAFLDVNGWNDTRYLPQLENNTNQTYIVSGLGASDGLTRCVMAELPTRPLQSLAQLQHFDARNNNPIPPFQFNLIGNGSAHPLFEPGKITINTVKNSEWINDDCYVLNHLLFDDWFLSSIAPELRDFSASSIRSYNTVYQDHVKGTKPLPNRFYRPARRANVSSTASIRHPLTGQYTYQTIASEIEVEGMFNINSVSVDAWKAILRHSREMQVPYITPSGSTAISSSQAFPYPRTSIAGDRAADSGSTNSNPGNALAAQFAGYREFTDQQIEALAVMIVDQIKKRGPFLSLSEFVNRQLSSDKDLAIASALQHALDALARLGSSPQNPYASIQAVAHEITSPPPGNTDYKFPEAALGSSAFGVPGWARQADILTPIAPVLSARDDTFTIRAYGDSRDRSNAARIVARAWCEVTVCRSAEFVDQRDAAELSPHSSSMLVNTNQRFGRRYVVVSFRWLNEAEV